MEELRVLSTTEKVLGALELASLDDLSDGELDGLSVRWRSCGPPSTGCGFELVRWPSNASSTAVTIDETPRRGLPR